MGVPGNSHRKVSGGTGVPFSLPSSFGQTVGTQRRALNGLVYEVYELTEQEIRIIEGSVR